MVFVNVTVPNGARVPSYLRSSFAAPTIPKRRTHICLAERGDDMFNKPEFQFDASSEVPGEDVRSTFATVPAAEKRHGSDNDLAR